MSWTVEQVISKFRDLTGRKSTNQISDANILIEVNHYFQHIFPDEVHIHEFAGWYDFNTVDGTGSQAIPDDYIRITSPVYVDDEEVTFWTDVQRFYEEYPHDYTTEDLPSDILLLDRTLIIRPIPDDVYAVKLRSLSSIPSALTTGNLDNPKWGPTIAYGSSIMFLMDKGEQDVAAEHKDGYMYHLGTIDRQVILQRPIGMRPPGGRF